MTTATALCATLLPTVGDLWFSTDPADREAAKRHCGACPLLLSCREASLADPTVRGVWGGLSSGDRRVLRTGLDGPDPDDEGEDGRLPRRPAPACGTPGALIAHRQRGEECVLCEEAHGARLLTEWRARLEAAHAAGGSTAGYHLHRKLGEEPCALCRTATTADRAESKARRRSRGLAVVPGSPDRSGRARGAQTATGAAA
jgi:hypothetical protein